jgi:hypothetical protein
MSKENKDIEDLAPVQTTGRGEMLDDRRASVALSIHDAVFGEVADHRPNYRNVSSRTPQT